jgi:serine protease Do
VVSIVVTQDLSKYYNENSPFNFFFNYPQGEQEVGAGSGFIVSSDGLIVTNKHVVSTTEAEYTVVLNDGTTYDAEVLAQDPTNDIAVVKVEASGLPVVELGDSDSIQIGQTVIAIGNALGEYSNTVTRGIISGLSRTVTAGDQYGALETIENTIQTDAAINPGNSGGPLLNLAGQVIGINTAISQEGQLIGFAIPSNEVIRDVESVQSSGRIVRPFLGVRYVLVNEAIKEANNLTVDYGALLVRGETAADLAVVPGSPADKAGLEENDIILEIDGVKINEDHSLAGLLAKYNAGDEITLKVLHDGQEKTVKATLTESE